MIKNCHSVKVKNLKESELFSSSATGEYTLAEAQAIYDAYIAAGYVQYDVGDAANLGFQNLTNANSWVCVWKDTDPQGMYNIASAYFSVVTAAGFNVVILGFKLDGADAVTAVNLDVWFTNYASTQETLAIKLQGGTFNFWKPGDLLDITGVELAKAKINVRYGMSLGITNAGNSEFNLYCKLSLTSVNQVENFKSNIYYTNLMEAVDSVDISRIAFSMVCDGKYIYCGSESSNLLTRILLSDLSITTLDIGQVTDALTINATHLFAGGVVSSNLKRVLLSDFATIATLAIGQITKTLTINATHLYAGGSSGNLKRVLLSDFATIATLALGQGSTSLAINSTHLYSGDDGTNNLKRVLLSDFTTIATLGISQITYKLAINSTHLFAGCSTGNNLKRILLSDFATIDILNVGQRINTMAINSTHLFIGGSYSNELKEILLSDFTSNGITILNIPDIIYIYRLLSLGDYIYFSNNTNYIQKVLIESGVMDSQIYSFSKVPIKSVIIAADYITQSCDLKVRYKNVQDAQLGSVSRQYYTMSLPDKYGVDDALKRFGKNRYWLFKREDVEAILIPAGTGKKIIDYEFYDNDGTTPFTFTDLTEDENWLILATNVSDATDVQYFAWYSEALYRTIYTNPAYGATYLIEAVFQIMKFDETEFDIMNLLNIDDSPLEAQLVFNLQDNEILVI